MEQQCVAVDRAQQPAVIGVLLLMLLMIPTRLEWCPFIYSKLQSVRVKREARMRARGKSCPQTAPCPLMTVQQGHAVDFQPISFPVFAHAEIHGVCVCVCVCVCVSVLVYGCETGARFLWACRQAPGRH